MLNLQINVKINTNYNKISSLTTRIVSKLLLLTNYLIYYTLLSIIEHVLRPNNLKISNIQLLFLGFINMIDETRFVLLYRFLLPF